MATKDYVTHSHNIRRKSKKNTKQAPGNWFRICLAILLLLGFGYGLYYLTTVENSGKQQDALENKQGAAKKAESLPMDVDSDEALEQVSLPPLPEMQEEQWEYIDSLPDFEVEVDSTGPLESDRQYIMQCGSFRTFDRADELKAKLAFQGLESRILKSEGKNGIWYRVVLGPYDRKRNAEKERHLLRDADIRGCKIW